MPWSQSCSRITVDPEPLELGTWSSHGVPGQTPGRNMGSCERRVNLLAGPLAQGIWASHTQIPGETEELTSGLEAKNKTPQHWPFLGPRKLRSSYRATDGRREGKGWSNDCSNGISKSETQHTKNWNFSPALGLCVTLGVSLPLPTVFPICGVRTCGFLFSSAFPPVGSHPSGI